MKNFPTSLGIIGTLGCLARTTNECPQPARMELVYILQPVQHTSPRINTNNSDCTSSAEVPAVATVSQASPAEVREYLINTLTPLIPQQTGYSLDAYPTVRIVVFPTDSAAVSGLMVQGYYERYAHASAISSYELYSLNLVPHTGSFQISNASIIATQGGTSHDLDRSTVTTAISSFTGLSLGRTGSLCVKKNAIDDVCYRTRNATVVCGVESVCATTNSERFRAVRCTNLEVCLNNYYLRLDAHGNPVDPITGLSL